MKFRTLLLIAVFANTMCFNTACKRDSKSCIYPYVSENIEVPEDVFRPGGGSSGMVQISDNQYLTVYDLKRFEDGPRMGLVTILPDDLKVEPLEVTGWDETGISSDLESICVIPGKANQFLMAESGAWQENTGRIFHVRLDTSNCTVTVLGHFNIPEIHPNDFGVVGDQYEAMLCLPYEEEKVIVVLGERGGSEVNPKGIIRWGVADLESYELAIEGAGLKGIQVSAPGEWTQETHRHITDFFIDEKGFLWTAGCEDVGDLGPFYSVIYKVGMLNKNNTDLPIDTSIDCLTYKVIDGFKIEALSGSAAGIDATHSFGTEDELFGGVWRPINIK